MSVRFKRYKTLKEMYELYSLVDRLERLKLEGHEYTLIGTKRTSDSSWLQVYRCEKEQHNLLVYTRGFIPYLIKPIYSINGISLEEASAEHEPVRMVR